MQQATIETRVAALEAEVAHLKRMVTKDSKDTRPWWEKIYGSFQGDPDYKEAMELGRKYRESTKPKPRKRKQRAKKQ